MHYDREVQDALGAGPGRPELQRMSRVGARGPSEGQETEATKRKALKSSYPLLLPLSPKVCSLHLWLLCCPIDRIIGTIFLYSIHMHEYTVLVFLFLTNFTIYDRLYVHPPH